MKFDEFTEAVREKLESRCEDGDTVKVCTVLKNNSQKLTGVIIKKRGVDVCPTVYLESYYEEYCDGSDIYNIADEIFRLSGKPCSVPKFSLDRFKIWEHMREQIMFKLINTEKNSEFLSQVPHRDFMNLSIVYYIRVDNSMDVYATTVIRNEHMKLWDVTEEELYECARNNNERVLPGKVKCMSEMLCDILGSSMCDDSDAGNIIDELSKENCTEMYVATNRDNMYGASVMLDDGLLEHFARLHGNFYILPSSVHELIFVPDKPQYESGELLDMVKKVNETEVEAVDVLSDDIYYYDMCADEHLKLIK